MQQINDHQVPAASTVRQRVRYLPLADALRGMQLAENVKDGYRRCLLPQGTTLTQENIQQLQAHHIEFICVSHADHRTAERIAVDSASAAHAVLEIFDHTDLTDPVMAALFNQVLMYRSA